jgi:GNAT superfamily N-acetyltransferase
MIKTTNHPNTPVWAIASEVWQISSLPQVKKWLGGPLYLPEVVRAIQNYGLYHANNCELPSRERVLLGYCSINGADKVVGYQDTTILREANPTQYEKDHLNLKGTLDYAQCKVVLVDPVHWGRGIGNELVESSKALALKHGLEWVVDVKADNKNAIGLFKHHGAVYQFSWINRPGKVMHRMHFQPKTF